MGHLELQQLQKEKKGAEELNYLCQSSLSVTGIHLSYHSTFLGLMIRHYLELGRRKTEVIWLLERKKKKMYYPAQLTNTEFQRSISLNQENDTL